MSAKQLLADVAFDTVLETMRARFRSGNAVEVERAFIKPFEWAVVVAELDRLRAEARQLESNLTMTDWYECD